MTEAFEAEPCLLIERAAAVAFGIRVSPLLVGRSMYLQVVNRRTF